jgi:hypothetical protein
LSHKDPVKKKIRLSVTGENAGSRDYEGYFLYIKYPSPISATIHLLDGEKKDISGKYQTIMLGFAENDNSIFVSASGGIEAGSLPFYAGNFSRVSIVESEPNVQKVINVKEGTTDDTWTHDLEITGQISEIGIGTEAHLKPHPGEDGKDEEHNIKELFPTTKGGRYWYSNWHKTGARQIKTDGIKNINNDKINFQEKESYIMHSFDPADDEFYVHGETKRVDIDGKGALEYEGPNCRFYIVDHTDDNNNADPTKKKWHSTMTWQNVEITVYHKRIDDERMGEIALKKDQILKQEKLDFKGNVYPKSDFAVAQLRLGARSNHFVEPIKDCRCAGRAYTGEANFYGKLPHTTAEGTIYVRKEIAHDAYTEKLKEIHWEYPKEDWIGWKLVVQNCNNNTNVRTRLYRDLHESNTWEDGKPVIDYTDTGAMPVESSDKENDLKNWIASSECKNCKYGDDDVLKSPSQIFLNPAHSCYIRCNNVYKAQLKKFSVREIDPLP